MKSGVMIVSVIFIFVLMSALASAGNVAYIFRKNFKINQGAIDALEQMGHNVDLVEERNLPLVPGAYDLIFVGDERFRKPNEIPVGSQNAVIASYHHGNNWGLTDRDGISQMGSTFPLSVEQGEQMIPVYTSAFKRNRIAVPYYYLDGHDVMPEMIGVASARRTSSGRDFGDVIAYRDVNGVKTCFFGIIESGFWTQEARDLFSDCVGFVAGGSPVPPPVPPVPECVVNSDCPADETSLPFCFSGGNVHQNVTSFSCVSGSCVGMTNLVLVGGCFNGCSGGMCLPPSGAGGHDVGFVDFTNSVDMIRLEHTNGTDILQGEDLMCGLKYKVSVRLENFGNFTEDVSFVGSVGGVPIIHNDITGHAPGVKKLKTKTVNFSLSGGTYDIEIEAFIDGFVDDNPGDNFVTRQVNVLCV